MVSDRAAVRLRLAMVAALACALAPSSADGQRVRLEIRPRIGDTIQMRLDQEIELSGTSAEEAAGPLRSMTGTMQVHTRAIPLRRIAAGTLVRAITDSVAISPVGGSRMLERTRRSLQNRSVELRVAADGGMDVVNTGEHEGDTPPFFGPMPPMLPNGPVNVRGSWTKDLSVPVGSAADGAARVRATFRLDSLSGNGDIAYITMQGTLSRASAPGGGGSQRSTGTLSGSLQLDRRLGWITDTRMVLSVRTVVTSTDPARSTAYVHMKVTQRLRAMRD